MDLRRMSDEESALGRKEPLALRTEQEAATEATHRETVWATGSRVLRWLSSQPDRLCWERGISRAQGDDATMRWWPFGARRTDMRTRKTRSVGRQVWVGHATQKVGNDKYTTRWQCLWKLKYPIGPGARAEEGSGMTLWLHRLYSPIPTDVGQQRWRQEPAITGKVRARPSSGSRSELMRTGLERGSRGKSLDSGAAEPKSRAL